MEQEIKGLTPWEKVQVSRHPQRPLTIDYIENLFEDFVELHGDRLYGDDPALIGGIGIFKGQGVVIIGHNKGKNVKENVSRNFGMPHPEGYRKALRLMRLAERWHLPVISFIDTPGAYPGIGAEERGQAEAIGRNILEAFEIRSPIIVVVIGEGGSGGALGIGVGDRILMLENAIYSVISPEGCAAIIWKDSKQAERAASALKLTAQDLLRFNIIDEIIPEPPGGAHNDINATIKAVEESIARNLEIICNKDIDSLLEERYQKVRKIGIFEENLVPKAGVEPARSPSST
ncbi:MAG: acetyl-CoA carboxylase carboxyltransferase subunit alpha [bacterium]|nr:acetyl-CoA carboxylase carboxyltransferase subunit alpha [bacterium]